MASKEELDSLREKGKLKNRPIYFYVLYDWETNGWIVVPYTEEGYKQLQLPEVRSDWERLYRCSVWLEPPVQGTITTIELTGRQLYDEDDALDLKNESLAYAFGRRLWSHTEKSLPTKPRDTENRQGHSRWVKDPFTCKKDKAQSFTVETRGKRLRVTIVEEEPDAEGKYRQLYEQCSNS